MYYEYKEILARQVTQVLNDRMPIQSEWKKTELTFIRRTHHVLLMRHLTNASRNLNAPYAHAET